MSNKKVNLSLTIEQVDLLRGVLYEYYNNPNNPLPYQDDFEKQLHNEIEIILKDAENLFYKIG